MQLQEHPGINVTVEVTDGKPVVKFNSHGRSYAVDKAVTAQILQACIHAKGFPKADRIVNGR